MELERVTHKWCWGELLDVILDWFKNVVVVVVVVDITVIVISVRSNKIIVLNMKCNDHVTR